MHLTESKFTSGGLFRKFGGHAFVAFSCACKKLTAVSHSGTKAEVIPLDTAPRIEGLLALTLLDVAIDVLELPAGRARGDPSRHFQAKTFIERQRNPVTEWHQTW